MSASWPSPSMPPTLDPTPYTAPALLDPLTDRAHESPDLRRALWGTTEALEAVARELRPLGPASLLAIEAARLGRRALTEDVITIGLLPLEDAAEAQAETPLASSIVHYCMAFRMSSTGQHDPCRAALMSCLRALSLAIARSPEPDVLRAQAMTAYALGELRVDPPVAVAVIYA